MLVIATYILAAFTLAAAAAVVIFRDPIHSALSLVLHLLGMASLYATLDAHFLAVAQVVVYAGAIMVLVLFVLMLLNLKVETARKVPFLSLIAAAGVGILFLFIVVPILVTSFGSVSDAVLAENALRTNGTTKAMGLELYTNWVVPFELASLLIMAGVVGAVVLARGAKRTAVMVRGEKVSV